MQVEPKNILEISREYDKHLLGLHDSDNHQLRDDIIQLEVGKLDDNYLATLWKPELEKRLRALSPHLFQYYVGGSEGLKSWISTTDGQEKLFKDFAKQLDVDLGVVVKSTMESSPFMYEFKSWQEKLSSFFDFYCLSETTLTKKHFYLVKSILDKK